MITSFDYHNQIKHKTMKDIKLLKKQADKLQEDLDALRQTILKQENGNITEIEDIKTLQDASKVLGISKIPLETDEQIKFVARAINKLIDNNCNFPDWFNTNEKKHYPYFRISGLGLVFFGSCWVDDYSLVSVAYVKSKEGSDHLGNQFKWLYEERLKEKY